MKVGSRGWHWLWEEAGWHLVVFPWLILFGVLLLLCGAVREEDL